MHSELVEVVIALADPTLPVGVSRERVIRAIQTHRVAGSRMAGRWLVNPKSLRQWVEATAPRQPTGGAA